MSSAESRVAGKQVVDATDSLVSLNASERENLSEPFCICSVYASCGPALVVDWSPVSSRWSLIGRFNFKSSKFKRSCVHLFFRFAIIIFVCIFQATHTLRLEEKF